MLAITGKEPGIYKEATIKKIDTIFIIRLNELDIYQLGQLQTVDVSNNYIREFKDMSYLKSLRDMDASYNYIEKCEMFESLPALMALSLKHNNIRTLTGFGNSKSHQLESLNLSFNRIELVDSVESLGQLTELNMNHNYIRVIRLTKPMEKVYSLKLSFNRLNTIDLSVFPAVKILFLDHNQIQNVHGASLNSKLASFSLRDQGRENS